MISLTNSAIFIVDSRTVVSFVMEIDENGLMHD
ncbi:hypothetical protein SAMN06265219_10339 [Gracilimonas mengyeensis]|uniref:Uncharacterized protein n=1 Tax=Gracilimonas mengyeensis TaxID=1302730 RepID=A0A521BSK3_9BACT|nr:hypothetical protein SAMN06265219_10339 [Gracilimonas mengyeensis]